MNTEDGGCSAEILVMGFEHAQDMILFEFCQRNPPSRLSRRLHGGGLDRLWEILGKYHRMRRQRNGALDGVFQLDGYAGPPIACQQGHRLGRDTVHRRRFFGPVHLDEVLGRKGISSTRSRSGGMLIVTTLSR